MKYFEGNNIFGVIENIDDMVKEKQNLYIANKIIDIDMLCIKG